MRMCNIILMVLKIKNGQKTLSWKIYCIDTKHINSTLKMISLPTTKREANKVEMSKNRV